MDDTLRALKQKWLSSGSFEDEQAYLAARVRLGEAQYIFLDPDGTQPPWLAVVIRRETGVVYATQCAGVAVEKRLIEGYLVPLGGFEFDGDGGQTDPDLLVQIFHQGDACIYTWKGGDLPDDRLRKLSRLVEKISYWQCSLEVRDVCDHLQLDPTRHDEIAEAWIPVITPDGTGVLLYKNCD